jgi:putative ATP-dependent endonuclease of OLD family
MVLRQASIENFRGLRRLEIVFGPTTVLIGENGSGKTNLTDALRLCLDARQEGGGIALRPEDFSRDAAPGAELRIQVEFGEAAGEGCPPAWRKRLGAAITPRGRLRLRVTGRQEGGGARAEWMFLDDRGQPVGGTGRPELLAALRELSPVLFIDNSRPAAGESQLRRFLAEPDSPADPRGNVLRDAARRLVRGKAGAWEEVSPEELEPAIALSETVLQETVARLWKARAGKQRRLVATPDGGVQRLMPLLLVLAVIEARGRKAIEPDARPIVVLEYPERNLHPTVLSTAWSIIDVLPAQKIVSTHSPELLALMPIEAIRRVVRRRSETRAFRLLEDSMPKDDRRKLAYHIRRKRGGALFARCWLLIEGETEFWLLPEMAAQLGYDLSAEGVAVVEFAQCGIAPLARLADALGIEWHLLTDGDAAGETYARIAGQVAGAKAADRVTRIEEADIEAMLWAHGYQPLFERVAKMRAGDGRGPSPRAVIRKAIERTSKPALAVEILEEAAREGSPGVPPPLRSVIETAVKMARGAHAAAARKVSL